MTTLEDVNTATPKGLIADMDFVVIMGRDEIILFVLETEGEIFELSL